VITPHRAKLPMSRRQRGQALTEFALILPVILLLFMGVFDFGRAIYAYNVVSNAAREGGRTAIVNQTLADIKSRAVAQATALGIPSSGPCVGGVPTGSAGVFVSFLYADLTTDCSATLAPGCVAVVTVKYTFSAITPIIGNVIGPLSFGSTTKQVIESTCSGSGCPIP
jgi:Flp pilus assembly protein TadG